MKYCNVSTGEFLEFLFNLRGEMNINCLFIYLFIYLFIIRNTIYKNDNTKQLRVYTAYEEANRCLFRYTLCVKPRSIYARFRRTY